MAEATPAILFGACDRHNLGDLLFPHIVAALVSRRPVIVAGVAERDLTAWGGHRVAALARLAAGWEKEWGQRPADVVHVGGELLTCSLYEAAVMTLPPEAARAAIARYDRDEARRQAWAQDLLGLKQQVAYLAAKALFPRPGRFIHLALGGVELPRLPAAMRSEVFERLRESDARSVRDRFTQAALAETGLHAELIPDPAELVAELFGERIAHHAVTGEPARVRERFAQGYVAVQFAAEFGDDATLARLAQQLDRVAADTDLGLIFFLAGTAPWHDDLAVYRRLLGHLQHRQTWLFESLDIWDLCALLAHARLYLGSSLHGRIVAGAFGVPGVSLVANDTDTSKVSAYVTTWYEASHRGVSAVNEVAHNAAMALAWERRVLAAEATSRAQAARTGALRLFAACHLSTPSV